MEFSSFCDNFIDRNHVVNGVSIVIFGASGDLTEKKLIPALHRLFLSDLLPVGLPPLPVPRQEGRE